MRNKGTDAWTAGVGRSRQERWRIGTEPGSVAVIAKVQGAIGEVLHLGWGSAGKANVDLPKEPSFEQPPLNAVWRKVIGVENIVAAVCNAATGTVAESNHVTGLMTKDSDFAGNYIPIGNKIADSYTVDGCNDIFAVGICFATIIDARITLNIDAFNL